MAGDLRRVCLADKEVVNRVYFALRDENWQTVPGTIASLSIKKKESSFSIKYRCRHVSGLIRFSWDAWIEGNDRSEITFSVEGVAESTFLKNRIGLCVLHPLSAVGDDVVVTHPDGSATRGFFPRDISPHQPFKDIRSIHHLLGQGGEVEILFSGDRFEMEDQRNWTDGSFKTYSTPLDDPSPLRVEAGTRFTQSVTIRLLDAPRADNATRPPAREGDTTGIRAARLGPGDPRVVSFSFPPALVVGTKPRRLPNLGLCCGILEPRFSDDVLERIASLNLAFLRIELVPGSAHDDCDIENCARIWRQTGVPLEIVFRLGDAAERDFSCLLRNLDSVHPNVSAWVVLSEKSPTTRPEHLAMTRPLLAKWGGGIPLGGGSRVFFAELNRFPPPVDLLDFCVYPVTPQVHATDELSIIETLPGQRATVESALHLFPGRPVHVGPITLKPRSGSIPEPDERQHSSFAAVWTMGSVISLAAGGAHSAVYYEILGKNGVMERREGSRRNPSTRARTVAYPVFSVFEVLGEMAGSSVVDLVSSNPLAAGAALLCADDRSRLFVTNYSASPKQIEIADLPDGGRFHAIDEGSSREAGKGNLVLGAHGVCWIEWGNQQTP